jgi:hypothetical protein
MTKQDLETAKFLGIQATPETKQAIDDWNKAIAEHGSYLAEKIDADILDIYLTTSGKQ